MSYEKYKLVIFTNLAFSLPACYRCCFEVVPEEMTSDNGTRYHDTQVKQ